MEAFRKLQEEEDYCKAAPAARENGTLEKEGMVEHGGEEKVERKESGTIERAIIQFEEACQQESEPLKEYMNRLKELGEKAFEQFDFNGTHQRIVWRFVDGVKDQEIRAEIREGWMKDDLTAKSCDEVLRKAQSAQNTKMLNVLKISKMASPNSATDFHQEKSDFRRPDTNEEQSVNRSHFSFEYRSDHIGKGSFGEVYRATHTDSGVQVAIKVIKNIDMDDGSISYPTESFIREMSVLRKASEWRCDNIVHFYGYIQYSNRAWLLLKFMDYDLSKVIEKLKSADSNGYIVYDADKWPCNVLEMLGYMLLKNVANGLRHVHGNNPDDEVFMHRDIKPTNIMVSKPRRKLAIIDFGSTKKIASRSMKLHSADAGCPLYLAPECLENNPEYDEKCDVWSTGITLIYFLTGVHPIHDDASEASTTGMRISNSKIYDRITGHIDWPVGLVSESFSDEFKSLVNSCVSRKVEMRPSATKLYGTALVKLEELGQEIEEALFDQFFGLI